MKWTFAVTMVAALLMSGTALVQETAAFEGGCQTIQCGEADPYCGMNQCSDRSGLIGAVELTFMKYMQEGGVADIDGTSGNFDLHCAPRFELGWMGKRDVGFRARYWFYDNATTSNDGDILSIDTYYADLELFHNRRVGRKTDLEFSLGLRYLDFRQDTGGNGGVNLIKNEFEGWGGTLGIEAKHPIRIGKLYARGRWTVLLGNADIQNYANGALQAEYNAHDTTSTMTELGIGWEGSRSMGGWGIATVRAGGEWQMWDNVAVGDTVFGGIGNDDVMEDAGFAGLVLRFELRR